MKKANHKDTKIKKKDRKRAVSGYLETISNQVAEINQLRCMLANAQSKLRSADTELAAEGELIKSHRELTVALRDRVVVLESDCSIHAEDRKRLELENTELREDLRIHRSTIERMSRELAYLRALKPRSVVMESGAWLSDAANKEGGQ